jgi:hypothetical protein
MSCIEKIAKSEAITLDSETSWGKVIAKIKDRQCHHQYRQRVGSRLVCADCGVRNVALFRTFIHT